jgi:hypothetical protein
MKARKILSMGMALALFAAPAMAQENPKIFSVTGACFHKHPVASIKITGQKGVTIDGLYSQEDDPENSVPFRLEITKDSDTAIQDFACRPGEWIEISVPVDYYTVTCRCHAVPKPCK